MKYHYTYLITNLQPTSTERYYLGVRSCNQAPADDIAYMGSSSALSESINCTSIHQFEKIIINSTFSTREAAEIHELILHEEHNVASNPEFYNKKNGTVGFHITEESIQKRSKTTADPRWKETTGKAKIEKIKLTLKKTVNRNGSPKQKATINDPHWKETVGKQARAKAIQTFKETTSDPSWKETTGKEMRIKERKTKSDPAWIAANTFTCEHCSKEIFGKGPFNRYHNDKCKHK